MAKQTTKYVVTSEEGSPVELSNLGKVASFLGVKKITKADLEAGKYPMVTLMDASDDVATDLELKDQFATLEQEQEDKAHLSKFDTEDSGIEVPDDADSLEEPAELDDHTKEVLDKIGNAINATPEDNTELFDSLCNLEDAITDGVELTEAQATLLTQILTGTLVTEVVDEEDAPPLTNTPPANDTEYPEVGDFKDEKAIKKFIKGLSDASLEEWCILEGAKWTPNDHESINRMRMAMAIKALHFPATAPKKGKKSKSKYASYETEDLVRMALENDVEVPDDKGDMKICRMYTIMALRKAGVIE